MGPTVDRVLIGELFGSVIEASKILERDADLRAYLEEALRQLPPYQVGKHGQVQEWLEDYDEAVPGHRHTSHLLGLFPFAQISPHETPELAQAARVTIERRVKADGYEEGAWARNNLTLFFARLGDAPAAYTSLMTLFSEEAGDSLLVGTRLAPAQAYEMDFNTGASAGIAEMVMQSQSGTIVLLPALPAAWPAGQFSGLRARGGFEVDLVWRDGKPYKTRIRSLLSRTCKVRGMGEMRGRWDEAGVNVRFLPNDEVEFETKAGKEYVFQLDALRN
jgi:alpha-L-fucosidase 2